VDTEVGFKLAGGPQPLILVPVSVNGSAERDFILDTGAGTTLLTIGMAAQSGVRATGTKEGLGAAGRIAIQTGQADSLQVGRIALRDTPALITDDVLRIGAAIGATVHGTLGHSFFGRFRMTVDYRRCRLRLDSERHVPGPEGVSFRLAHSAKPLVVVDALVDGKGPYPFAVDTGASTTVISTGMAQSLGVESRPIPAVTGGGGTLQASAGTIRSLAAGSARRENLSVIIGGFMGMLSQATGTRLEGIVGHNFLSAFQVILDYPNALLILSTGGPKEPGAA
jgi:predicted aspartyl protease